MAEPRSAAEFAEASAETELKFLISEESIAQLSGHRALKSPEQSSRLRSIYFDTLDHALRDAGLSLRVREADGSLMQTIKRRTSPGQVARDEWEQPIASAEPDRAGFARTPVARLLEEAAPDLQPLFVTDVNRSVRYWTQADALIEISLDRGEVVAGTRREPILELELELKRGSPAALFELARDLSQTAPLRLSFESKGERGYRLAGHDGIIAYKADAAQVGSGQPTAEALQAIARSCLSQLLANADQFLRRRNPEALHQLRIGLRRLRAAMSTFKSLLGDAQSQHLKAEAKWLSGELNAARDLDVFLQDTLRPEEQAREHPAELEPLAKWLALAQAKAYDRAFAALESPRFSALVLEVAAWTEVGAWASPAEPEARAALEHPVEQFARPRLQKLRRKVRRQGRQLADLDPEPRHDLRIATKKLRYATEFFGDAFNGKGLRRRRAFLSALKGFQDALGGLNDVSVAERVAGEAVRQAGARLAFQAGVLVGARRNDEAALLRKAQACFEAFKDARPFWA